MGHKLGDLEKLQKKLEQLPAINESEREVTKLEAVRRIAPTITALQERGYSMERIAEIITNEGLEIKPQALKSYLTRVRKPVKGRSQRSTKAVSRNPASDRENAAAKKPPGTRAELPKSGKNSAANTKSSAFLPHKDSSDI